MGRAGRRSESEVITAMKDTFSSAELTALRNDLIHDVLIDSREAAELLQLFLMGRGFGASPEAARDAVGRVEMSGCSIPVLQRELEDLALVM
jgi:hypothetical protein